MATDEQGLSHRPETAAPAAPASESVAASGDDPRLRRWPITLTGLVVLVLFTLVFYHHRHIRFLNAVIQQTQDILIGRNAVAPQSGKVLMVDFDDASLAALGQWPWPRFRIAQLTDRLWDAGAAVIALDVGFKEPDGLSPAQAIDVWREVHPDLDDANDLLKKLPDFDELLAQSLARGPTVIGFFIHLVNQPVEEPIDEALVPWRGMYSERGSDRGRNRRYLYQGRQIEAPIETLRNQAMLGFFNAIPDHDNIVRRTPMVVAIGGVRLYPALGLEAVRLAFDAPRFEVHYDTTGVAGVREVRIGDLAVPTDRMGALTVNFRSKRFPTLRALDVLENRFSPDQVRGKVIVIGTSAIGLTDRIITPLNEEVAGAEIHATVIDNLLAGDILSEPRWMFYLNLAALFLGGVFLIVVVTRTRAMLSVLVLLFALIYPMLLSLFLLRHYRWLFVPTPLMIGWGLTYAGVIIMKYWQQEIIAQYDARLREVNRQLGHEVEVRKAAEMEANEARNAALRAAAAKSEFLANMSHEIRTPMNSVIGMSDLALRTELTAQQRNYIGKVRYSAHALLRLINDILDFSKLEAGKIDIEQTEFNLDAALGDIIDLLGPQAFKKSIELILNCEPTLPRAVIGDPLRLRQVLINLAANAIKFTEKGHVVIKVSPVQTTDTEAAIRFEVIDTGIGLTPEQQTNLFKAFQQADTSTTRKYGGTGLGLAISQNLVHLMGGEIRITSQAGDGSNFHFDLRFGRQAAGSETPIELPEALHGRRILVAGGEPALINVLLRDTQSLALRAEALAEPDRLAERLAQAARAGEPFDLLLLDTAGLEPFRLLDRLPPDDGGDTAMPVILIAPPDFERDLITVAGNRPIHHLAKPIKFADLVSTLRVACGHDPLPFAVLWQTATTPAIAPDRLNGARVLLVDDNPVNREVATENMTVYGIRVEPAVNGREAIDKARTAPWNLILMDVQMPEVDGYEATRAIRQLEQDGQAPRSRTPILAMTANAMKEDEEKCRACGMDDYLSKPLDVDVFLAKLLQYIPREEIPLAGAPTEPEAAPVDTAATDPALDQPSEPVAPAATTTTDTARGDGMPAIPGADVAAGLKRLRGNTALYRRLLADFAVSHGNDPDRIRQAAARAEFEAARQVAHAVKGSAANLGLTEIQRLATGIDHHYRRNQPAAAADLVTPLENALRTFREAIAPFLPATTPAAPTATTAVVLDPELRSKMEHLVANLNKGDIEAINRFGALEPLLRAAGVAPSDLEHIAQALETFDFEKAAGRLEHMANAMEQLP